MRRKKTTKKMMSKAMKKRKMRTIVSQARPTRRKKIEIWRLINKINTSTSTFSMSKSQVIRCPHGSFTHRTSGKQSGI
jgi:hypothetical protein